MLKHLRPLAYKFLYKIICACFELCSTPAQWNIAHIYPIPKPKPFNCNLNNTRPITFLETVRKAFVRIINSRLQNIFLRQKALLGLNFTSLPHQSMTEPLHLINNILEYHRHHTKNDVNKENNLLILF